MILAGIEQRNFLGVMLIRVLRWLERPCNWINKTVARWWAEALCFISAALLSGMVVSYWTTNKVYGGPWWEAMTAFGTVGSVVLAICLASWNYVALRQERMLIAELSAIRLRTRVSKIMADLRSMKTDLTLDSKIFKAPENREKQRCVLESNLSLIAMEEVVAVSKATSRIGRVLITASEEVRVVSNALSYPPPLRSIEEEANLFEQHLCAAYQHYLEALTLISRLAGD